MTDRRTVAGAHSRIDASEVLCAAAAKEVDQLRQQVATLTPVETPENVRPEVGSGRHEPRQSFQA